MIHIYKDMPRQIKLTIDLTFLSALAYPKYGMTAVIVLAEALLQASIITRSSIRFSFAGGQVGCTRNTSHPLTLSCSWTYISPSAKRFILIFPRSRPI
jgi:hypothetical protein